MFAPLELRVVESRSETQLWTELIERYHYFAHRVPVGANLRYVVHSEPVGEQVLGIGSERAWDIRFHRMSAPQP